jgi:hypothetical protein
VLFLRPLAGVWGVALVGAPSFFAPPTTLGRMKMSATVSCPLCKGLIANSPQHAGREVGCPHCSGRVMMPAAVPSPPPLPVENSFDFLQSAKATVGSNRPPAIIDPFDRLPTSRSTSNQSRQAEVSIAAAVKNKPARSFPIRNRVIVVVVGLFCTFWVLAKYHQLFGDSPDVALVQNGHLKDYPNITIGKAAAGFMDNPSWDSGVSDDGARFVNVRGQVRYLDKTVDAFLQFEVYPDKQTFEVRALEFNGVPQNNLIKLALLAKMLGGD